jgi:transcriptional regulator with XRE-family HTH domain
MEKSVHSEPYAVFLTSLIEARKQLGLSQVELARRLGKPQSFISKIEIGERRLDVLEFLQIMRALEDDPRPIISKVQASLDTL